ncbi:MAG: SH3 domain-containing protein [Acidobacteria bacterium]|nr:SH3 domain-containing protein [Acidobacteriota bacterium]
MTLHLILPPPRRYPIAADIRPVRLRVIVRLVLASLLIVLQSCQSYLMLQSQEVAYTSEAQGELLDQLGPESRVIARIRSGQRVEILERINRWTRVRVLTTETKERGANNAAPPLEGWMHQRQIVSAAVFELFQKLAAGSRELPLQGKALVRRLANMRFRPGRTTQVFYQLAADEKVEVLRHDVATREPTADDIRRGLSNPIPEDWLLVRASDNRTGWVLETFIELVPPLEVARYRESQRIRAWFEIYKEHVGDQIHPWYLWATVPKSVGLVHDFEEIRVLVWNPAASRYETSYRERNLKGFMPIHVSMETHPEGVSPSFNFEHENSQGQRIVRRYYMIGRQVRLERAASDRP